MAATALPVSSALPPPKPITNSQCSCFANLTPASIVPNVGSPGTEKVRAAIPCSRKSDIIGSARRRSRPVTTSARRPNSRASAPSSRNLPAPKIIRGAVANSNCIRKDVREFHAGSRFGHHRRDGIPPDLVMFGLLVRSGCLCRAVRLHQHEARGIVLLLKDIEPSDARLFETFAGIGDGRLFESLNALRLYM